MDRLLRAAFRTPVFLSVVTLSLIGCRGTSPESADAPDTVVILIDNSGSVREATGKAYTTYLTDNVFPSLRPGSRITIELIVGNNTRSNPSMHTAKTLPMITPLKRDALYYLLEGDMSKNSACENRVNQEIVAFKNARDQLQKDPILNASLSSRQTFLLEGMREASDLLDNRPGRGILVVLSDGLEDSDVGHFDKDTFWKTHDPSKLAAQQPSANFQGLKGARVNLVGLAAPTGSAYEKVRTFWADFFKIVGVERQSIGHSPDFTEPIYVPDAKVFCGTAPLGRPVHEQNH